jgi:hypothetical protein
LRREVYESSAASQILLWPYQQRLGKFQTGIAGAAAPVAVGKLSSSRARRLLMQIQEQPTLEKPSLYNRFSTIER